MGSPITPPIMPDDCSEEWVPCDMFVCDPWCTENWCDDWCATVANCPPTISVDRGANINPRYCVYDWQQGHAEYWDGDLCQCVGFYEWRQCSDEVIGEGF